MATLARLYARYSVPGLLLAPELRDATFATAVDGIRVGLRFPADQGVFDSTEPPGDEVEPDPLRAGPPATVESLQVTVDIVMPYSALDERPEGVDYVQTMTSLVEPQRLATEVAKGVVGWARLGLEQVGLGLRGAPVSADSSRLLDLEAGRFYDLRLQELGWLSWRPNSARPVDSVFLEAVVSGGQFREPRPSAYELLADGRNIQHRGDHPVGVVLAAQACEMRAKQLLSESPRPPRSSNLAVRLFHTRAKEVRGRSMRDEDPVLFGAVDRFFQARNAFLHSGEEPSREAAGEAIHAALLAFRWMERVEGGLRHVPEFTPEPDRGIRTTQPVDFGSVRVKR